MSDEIKVLAVDDAPANLMILKGCPRGGNFELITSTNAIDALQEFKKQYFDILLLDVTMPGVDGFELRKLIREDGEFITKNELHDIVEALTADTDATGFPYRLKSMMEQMEYENISDDFTVVALQKRQCRTDCIERLIPAKLSEVNKVATEFSSIAKDLRQISEIELCVHEFLNNVIVHGNAGSNQRPDLIYINIAKEKRKFKIRGSEHGRKWDPSNMENIDGRNAEDRSSPATSGRGMQILQAITDHVTYNSYCDLNETCFTLKSGEKNDN